MSTKRVLLAFGIVAIAAVLLAVLRPDPTGSLDRLDDWDDVQWNWTIDPIKLTRYFDADVEAVRQARTNALEELGYSPTEAGRATRPDGAQLEIEVSTIEDGRVTLRLVAGAGLELPGGAIPEKSVLKAHRDQAARLAKEFFGAVLRHLE